MAAKRTLEEDLAPLQKAQEAGAKFLKFEDDGFACAEEDLPGLIRIMLDNTKNYRSAPTANESPGEDSDFSDDESEDDENDSSQKKKTVLRLDTEAVFHAVGKSVGTHSLKLVNPRSKNHILIVDGADYMAFPDSKYSGVVKVLFRPITVTGSNTPTSIFKEILNAEDGCNHSPLLDAARTEIGDHLIDAFRQGLREPREISALREEGIPVVFLPLHGGGDVQITPVSPGKAYMTATEIFKSYIIPHERDTDGQIVKRNRRGSFTKQSLSNQIQNVSAMISQVGPRVRMNATFPDIMRQQRAEVMAYAANRSEAFFPKMRDDVVTDIAIRLERFLASVESAGRRPELLVAVRNMARALANLAADHIADVMDEAGKIDANFRPSPVSIGQVLFGAVRGRNKTSEAAQAAIRTILADKTSRDEIDRAQEDIDRMIAAMNENGAGK